MISLLNALSVGNAVGIVLSPPSTAVRWRVLRNLTGTFVDQNSATLIYDGNEKYIIDTAALDNGVTVYYQPFYFNGVSWSTSTAKSISPSLSYVDRSVDAQGIIRDRLDVGLNSLVSLNRLYHPSNVVPVFTASPQFEDAPFPLVTVHLVSSNPATHGIGDLLSDDFKNEDDDWDFASGYLSSQSIDVVIWSLNGDERKEYRKQVSALLIANLPIFYNLGILDFDFQFSDRDDFETYASPMYTATATVKCQVPTAISGDITPAITDIITTVITQI